tara:strand:+ start:804 stop:920 length:117 start_codon:yes stop_codon:yes gene_type:complete
VIVVDGTVGDGFGNLLIPMLMAGRYRAGAVYVMETGKF